MAQQVKSTYILKDGAVLFETFSGKYFIASHIVGHYVEISMEEAMRLKLA